MKANIPLVVYVDVDDTLVRSAGTKRMPIPSVVAHVKQLAAQGGVELYCWSTAGAEYARATARELGVENCFVAFLPKPMSWLMTRKSVFGSGLSWPIRWPSQNRASKSIGRSLTKLVADARELKCSRISGAGN